MEWQRPRCREVYGESMKYDEEKDWSRDDAVSLRSGHSLKLRGYPCRIGLKSDLCRQCGELAMQPCFRMLLDVMLDGVCVLHLMLIICLISVVDRDRPWNTGADGVGLA